MPSVFVVGSLNADHVIPVARLPRRGETLMGRDLALFPGGKGANQAVAAARLGARVLMVGRVGPDRLGDLLLGSLRAAGVDTVAVERVRRPTGVALIQVLPGGDNAIVVSPGANATLTPAAVRSGLATVGPGDIVLCQLESPLDAVCEALQTAKVRGATTVLDPAPALRHLPETIWRTVDIQTPNASEAAILLGRRPGDPGRTLRGLLALGPPAAVLTLGEDGAWVATGDRTEHVPSTPVQALDTTAAGDTFNGALATGLSDGLDLVEAARFAAVAAAISVTRPGAQSSCPTREDVDSWLAERAPT